MKSVSDSILRRIRAKKRGWVFTPKHFIDLAPRNTVDVTLHRLLKKGIIRKIGHGMYDIPYHHPKLGILAVSRDSTVRAMVFKTGESIQPSGAMLANQLGLDTQVPAKLAYQTSGKARLKKIGNFPIMFRHSRFVSGQPLNSNVIRVISAIRNLGKNSFTDRIVNQCKKILSQRDKSQLKKNLARFPDWMVPFILKITEK